MKFSLLSLALWVTCFLSFTGSSAAHERKLRLLDAMDNMKGWRVLCSDDVSASLRADNGALRLDFDFSGVAGYASLRRKLPIRFQGNYALSLRVRGQSPVNTLQIKFIDASGENVWWIHRPDFSFSDDWQTVRAERRHIVFAWGPARDRTLRRTADVEITLAAGRGGRGHLLFADLKLEPLPPMPTTWTVPAARASSAEPGAAAALVLDGKPSTSWRSDPAKGTRQNLDIDFLVPRTFGGLVLHWLPGREATRYAVQYSDDGRRWRTVRRVSEGNGGQDPLLLPESCTRHVRLALEEGPSPHYGLSEVEVKDLDWGATPNAFFEALAKSERRGFYPRSYFGEQSYWTVVGVDGGGMNSALFSEDGTVEAGKGGFSVEPFLIADGRLLTWADVTTAHALADGYLPMPNVTWKAPDLTLRIEAFAAGSREDSRLLTRYTVENQSDHQRTVTLALAVRPFQVNPPTQSLNGGGGVTPIQQLAWDGSAVRVNGAPRVFPLKNPDAFLAGSFDSGDVVTKLLGNGHHSPSQARDEFGHASGAMLFHLTLPAQGQGIVGLVSPLSGTLQVPDPGRQDPGLWIARERDSVAAEWRAKLNRIIVLLPKSEETITNTLRTSLANILITRDGPALQPGTRSYARSWIRDGAMISEALLRMGYADIVRDFIHWYAPHQFTSGKVPCCVDGRGSDPVPENDSHGELIFTVAELYRFTHDRALLEALWSHVVRAIEYMERMRASERTPANQAPELRANYGLMPASISHEGYSAKPVHSYWDDFWALRGYDDAVYLAGVLGKSEEAGRIAEARDQFRSDLHESLRASVKRHNLDYLPGAAELGDFDPTSTTVALSPAEEQERLPQTLLKKTFERYWREFVARREAKIGWDAFTPYELRTLSAFTRLGWRDRGRSLLDFFLAYRRPAGWNGWAEVVGRDARKPRFIGDMPHAWIASDYIRSVLDMFVFRRAGEDAMVLAAGVPPEWLEGGGIGISGLHTPWGRLGFTLRREEDGLRLRLNADAVPPGGFILPWPYSVKPGEAQVNAGTASWRKSELYIGTAQADVLIKAPPKTW